MGPPDLDVAHVCSNFAMLHTTADAETFRAEYVRQGERLDPGPDGPLLGGECILRFLPDPGPFLTALATTRPNVSAGVVRLAWSTCWR